jgi:hypothetical protein
MARTSALNGFVFARVCVWVPRVFHGERQRLAGRLFVYGGQPHGRAALETPRPLLRFEGLRTGPDELTLLIARELDHPLLQIRMQGREDAAVEAEVGMPHVRTFSGTGQRERNPSEVVCRHPLLPQVKVTTIPTPPATA